MDVLGDLLAPYSDEIAKFAGTVTCLQFLSGVFLLNDIRKIGSSDAYPPEPFLGGVVLTVLSLKLGSLMGDMAMIRVNIIGFAINIIFMVVFYWYSSNEFKTKIWSKLGVAGLFTMSCLAYSNFEDAEKIEFRFGMLITAILVALVGLPLLSLGDVIARKSTEGMPFPIILSGTIVAASWMVYGMSIKNNLVTFQNMFLCLLSSVQLALFAIYPNTPTRQSDSKRTPSTLDNNKSKLRHSSQSASNIDKKND